MRRSGAAILLAAATPALAGPPYITDDPQPTDLNHWEVYAFGSGTRFSGQTDGTAGFDLNYGGLPDVQLTATVPFEFSSGAGERTAFGNLELGIKYRFYNRGGIAVAVFPRIIVPTAAAGRSPGKVGVLLPVWAEHDWQNWSLFGGGGYAINPGTGARDFVQGGIAMTHSLDERVSLGAEIAGRSADASGSRGYAALNFGGTVKLVGPLSLIASGGPGIVHGRSGGRWNFYAALAAVF